MVSTPDPQAAIPGGSLPSEPAQRHFFAGPHWLTPEEMPLRLQAVALIYGLGFLAVFLVRVLTTPGFGQRDTFIVEAATVGVSTLIAAIVVMVSRRPGIGRGQLVTVGLVFEVVAAFGIALTEQWGIFGSGPAKLYGISWICVWVLIFPLVVPADPARTMVASQASAAMLELAYLFSVAFDQSPRLDASLLIEMFYPAHVAALIAFFATRLLHAMRTDLRRARQMGCYRLEELLGRGGMGQVWRASHSLLTRPAAVKLISPRDEVPEPGRGADACQERFRLEAQATAAMRSPHTIQLYDFGVTREGVFYYVMELLDGVDLAKLVRRFGPVSAERTVYLLRQICHSLGEAHANGLIHRDVKPGNIFTCRHGRDVDFVKVLDFGIVKSRRGPEEGEFVTRGDFVCGTPEFMAPELILADRVADQRADIYALGGVAYWLLTGEPVFRGSGPIDVMTHQLRTEPAAPSIRTETEVPPGLDAAVLACLAKDPAQRPQSVDELESLLARAVPAGRWTQECARDWWDLHLPADQNMISKPKP